MAEVRQVSAAQLIADGRETLRLEWLAGHDGGARMVRAEEVQVSTVGVVGHMNFIHPFQIQVLGHVEFEHLNALGADERMASFARLFRPELAMVIVAGDVTAPTELLALAESAHTPLVRSPLPSPRVIDVVRLYLSRKLAESTTLHGVFLDVLELGVLITGASAIGKSELALELISRGHGLIADDIVELYRVAPDMVEGRCPAVLKDFLEVRGIGILNIRTIFGETAVRPRKSLKLIVHLEDHSNEKWTHLDRLSIDASVQDILGVNVRKVVLPVAAGRNLAVLIEAAVRNFVLNLRGIDSTREFIERQQRIMNEGSVT